MLELLKKGGFNKVSRIWIDSVGWYMLNNLLIDPLALKYPLTINFYISFAVYHSPNLGKQSNDSQPFQKFYPFQNLSLGGPIF